MAGSSEEAWRKSSRALSSTDLAMHVVLPELDGRIFAGAISFKDRDAAGAVFHQPHAQGIEHVAGLASAWVRLRRLARQDRKLALILSTYPGRPDQIAHAVGLDGPASALKLARHLQGEGYSIEGLPSSGGELVEPFVSSSERYPSPSPSPTGRGNAFSHRAAASPLSHGERDRVRGLRMNTGASQNTKLPSPACRKHFARPSHPHGARRPKTPRSRAARLPCRYPRMAISSFACSPSAAI